MEDSSVLKVRSDLYPNSNNPILMNETTAKMSISPSSLATKMEVSYCNARRSASPRYTTSCDSNNKPQNLSQTNAMGEGEPHQSNDWRSSCEQPNFIVQDKTTSKREKAVTSPPITTAALDGRRTSTNGHDTNKENDGLNPLPEVNASAGHDLQTRNASSPLEEGLQPLSIHGFLPHTPPALTRLLPEAGHENETRTAENTLYSRIPTPINYDTHPLRDSAGSPETLDLSTSSRSKEIFSLHPPKLTPSPTVSPTPPPFNPFGVFSGLARLQEMNPLFREGLEGVAKTPYNSSSSLYAANLPPHLLPWLISSQIQNLVQHQARSEGNPGLFGHCNGGFFLEDKDQQPLDLSAKKIPMKPLSDEDLVSRVLEIKPSTRGRRRADNSKRSYTEEELHAALRDIQSGKLGTRRAAVIYGIPRSTLRNKVYKLAMERDRNKKLIEQNEKLATILPDSTAHLQTNARQSKSLESVNQAAEASCETLKSMIRNKMTEKLEELSRYNKTYLTGGEKQQFVDSALTYLLDNIPKLALNTENKSISSDVLSSLSLYPQLQDFTHKIVEERFNEEIKRIKCRVNGSLLTGLSNGYKTEIGESGINIPNYPSNYNKNSSQGDSARSEQVTSDLESSHPSISSPQANLKDMIAQIINQKILSEEITTEDPSTNSSSSGSFLPVSVQRIETPFGKTSLKISTEEKSSQDLSKKRAKSPSSSGGKGSRPKRGKYRNYDRDNLLKAVQAVQSGEMSVHRAGSFYGVPHSTLEYKVKERHLNRGRIKKEAGIHATVPLLKSEKDNASFSSVFPTNSLMKDQYKNEIPDTTTKDLSNTDSRSNDEISIISVQHSPPKKQKHENDEQFSALPISSNPFLSNPFPFWNNASPILAPFLSTPYQTDPLYASQVMRDFQEAAIKLNNSESRKSSPSPNPVEGKFAEILSNENPYRPHGRSSNGGSVSSSPPPTPPAHEGLLNSLLRRRMESVSNEAPNPWKINSDELQKDQSHDTNPYLLDTSPSQPVPPPGLFTLKALLPSFMAARNSLAAAFSADNSSTNTSLTSAGSSPQSAAMSLVKGPSPMPLLGAHLSETP